MPSKVASFEIHHTRFLDEQGRVDAAALPGWAHDCGRLIELYRLMVLTRTFDAKAIALQRTGQLGTYASCLGQEAIGAAVGTAMRREDVLFPTYREQAAQLARGVRMSELLLYWGGDERGSDFAGPREDFPICVPIGTQTAHAVGVATAFKLRDEARVAACMGGDGATSRGDFYESINVAGVWSLPVVFVISNNQWAISVRRSQQTAAETLAQKAIAAGIPGLQVDGNDVIAVRWAVEGALERARRGDGPTLIEALTYRLQDHTTADDASRYRTDQEVSEQWKRDPIARTRTYLGSIGAWSKDDEERLAADCQAQVQAAVDQYLASEMPPPEAMFDHLYAELPAALAGQRRALMEEAQALEGRGDA
jgi:pyruvate dehydrogenase E1 component alpha subunit